MIDRVSLFFTAFTSIVSTAAIAVQISNWIVDELHLVGHQVQQVEKKVDVLERRLKHLEEAHQ